MLRHNGEYRVDVRHEMRGGQGEVKIEHFWEAGKELLSPLRMFARLSLEPGCSIGFHEHGDEEEIFVVVRGCAEVDDNGQKAILHPGDTLLTGNGSGHGVRNCGQETLELLAVIGKYVKP